MHRFNDPNSRTAFHAVNCPVTCIGVDIVGAISHRAESDLIFVSGSAEKWAEGSGGMRERSYRSIAH